YSEEHEELYGVEEHRLLLENSADFLNQHGRETCCARAIQMQRVLEQLRAFQRFEGVLVRQDHIRPGRELSDRRGFFLYQRGRPQDRAARQANEDDFGSRSPVAVEHASVPQPPEIGVTSGLWRYRPK